ncbi:hypothetical protein BC940DRAFT_302190 [Gongronella butleri]|nr:hypothetical protein BC940DRAFT_302190 [Gongronella butleri]
MAQPTPPLANALLKCFSDFYLDANEPVRALVLASDTGAVPIDKLLTVDVVARLGPSQQEIDKAVVEFCASKLEIVDHAVRRVKPYIHNKTIELDDWSIYVENLKGQYNTIDKIRDLFTEHVGLVSFARFPSDQQGVARANGMCFVEFNDKEHAQVAIDMFNSFDDHTLEYSTNEKDPTSQQLRVMSKQRYNEFEREYLEIKERDAATIKGIWSKHNQQNEQQESASNVPVKAPGKRKRGSTDANGEADAQPAKKTRDDDTATKIYPRHIIALVDHIHPKTTKTSLTALLKQSGASVAFVKYKKGLTRTHVRMASEDDTDKLVAFFESNHLAQTAGNDTKGTKKDAPSMETITVRALEGKEEEIYWEAENWKPTK